MHIAVAGNIGVGKTTLTGLLAKNFNWEPHYESVDNNPYLDDFYTDMQRWAFNLQVYFLNSRFCQLKEFQESGKNIIQDRTIYEDAVFANTLVNLGLMDDRDYRTYLDLFKHMSNFMCRPSIIVYLDIKPETSLKRIGMRARNVETGITLE